MSSLKSSLSYILIVFLGLYSCKVLKVPDVPTNPTLKENPKEFLASADTQTVARIPYKEFFTDADLISLIDTALLYNFDVLAMYQQLEIAKANMVYTKSLLRPTVNANAGIGIRKFGLYTMDGAGNKTTEIRDRQIVPEHLPDYLVGFQANWEIDIWGKLKNRNQAALYDYLATLEGKNWLITNLIAEIAINYYELLALDNELEILQENIKLQENSLAITKIQKEAGKSNELAVQQFEAQVLNSKSFVKELSQQIVETENNINLLLGRYPQPIRRSSTNLDIQIVQKVKEGIPSQLLQNRPDIRQAEQALFASQANVQAVRKAFYPTLTITSSLGLNAYNPTLLLHLPSTAYNVLSGLSLPLLNRKALFAEFYTATALQRQAYIAYQRTVMLSFMEVYNHLKNINNLDEINALTHQEILALNRAIDASNLLFQSGRANYLEVLNVQQNLLQTRIDLVENKKRQFQATINLYKSLGGGWQ